MSISVQKLNLNSNTLEFKNNKCPKSNPDLPHLWFIALMIASRNSGKTYTTCQLLKMYENYGFFKNGKKLDMRTILVTPTYHSNPCFTALKTLNEDDIYDKYSDELLEGIVEDIKNEKLETIEYNDKMKLWKKFLKSKIEDLNYEEIMQLEKMNYQEPEKCKYQNGCVPFLVIDDMVGTNIYKCQGNGAFTNLVLKNRQLGINIIMMSQNLKSIPKSIRVNTSVFFIWKFNSKVIVQDLYEEVSNSLTIDLY